MTSLSVLAAPRDPNPFQERLYESMRACGVRVAYIDGPSPSHTVNIALMPVLLVLRRLQGFTILHLHWTFGFVPMWARQRSVLARGFRAWYVVLLGLTCVLGYRIVWTAHNVLPHAPVFDDDVAARRSLVRRCAAVVAMNAAVADAVRSFSPSCEILVIPHGTDHRRPQPGALDASLRARPPGTTFVFFGRMERYKGVPDLLQAYSEATLHGSPLLIVAGACSDHGLETEIRELSAASVRDVRLVLRKLTDGEVDNVLGAADVLVFPFRAISTSGSVLTGMRSGTPVIVPDLSAFADIPRDALLRYSGGVPGLRVTLERASEMSDVTRDRLVEAGHRYLDENTWDRVALRHVELFKTVVGGIQP